MKKKMEYKFIYFKIAAHKIELTWRQVNVHEDMEYPRRKKTELQTSATNTNRLNEKLLDMEHMYKYAPLHGFFYIYGWEFFVVSIFPVFLYENK